MSRRLITLASLAATLVGPMAASASVPLLPEVRNKAVWNWVTYGYYDTEAECIAVGETRGDPPLMWWIQYNCSHPSVGDPTWWLQVYATW